MRNELLSILKSGDFKKDCAHLAGNLYLVKNSKAFRKAANDFTEGWAYGLHVENHPLDDKKYTKLNYPVIVEFYVSYIPIRKGFNIISYIDEPVN